MSRVRRVIAWTLFAGFLVGVGFVVFHFVRVMPRCTISGPTHVCHLAADGSHLVTAHLTATEGLVAPLQVWDLCNGALLHSLLGEQTIRRLFFAPDGLHMAVIPRNGILQLVDWQTGDEFKFDRLPRIVHVSFSSSAKWVVCYTEDLKEKRVIHVGDRGIALHTKKQVVCFHREDFVVLVDETPDLEFTLWDLVANKSAAELKLKPGTYRAAPDGNLLATWQSATSGGKEVEGNHGVDVWDLANFQHIIQHKPLPGHIVQAEFSRDGRTLALGQTDHAHLTMTFVDTKTGAARTTPTKIRYWDGDPIGGFSQDGSLWQFKRFALREEEAETGIVTIDSATGRVLWHRPRTYGNDVVVSSSGFWHQEERGQPWQLQDARTGLPMESVPKIVGPAAGSLVATPDARNVLLVFENKSGKRELHFWEEWVEKFTPVRFGGVDFSSVVIDASTGRERFRIGHRLDGGSMLSDDGSTLVTNERNALIRVWDVHAHRAWTWALSAVGGTWLGLWAVRRGVHRWRSGSKNQPADSQARNIAANDAGSANR